MCFSPRDAHTRGEKEQKRLLARGASPRFSPSLFFSSPSLSLPRYYTGCNARARAGMKSDGEKEKVKESESEIERGLAHVDCTYAHWKESLRPHDRSRRAYICTFVFVNATLAASPMRGDCFERRLYREVLRRSRRFLQLWIFCCSTGLRAVGIFTSSFLPPCGTRESALGGGVVENFGSWLRIYYRYLYRMNIRIKMLNKYLLI